MAKYVDGFVLIVPKNKVEAYTKMAKEGAKMWMDLGALDYKECMGDDLKPKMQKGFEHLTFPELTKVKPNETVWFSFITYKSRKHRDQVNAKVMQGMEKHAEKYKDFEMPFEMKKMAMGGFDVVVDVPPKKAVKKTAKKAK